MVELLGSYPRGQLDLLRIGEALSCQCFSSKQSPPRLLEVEPAPPYGYEDLLHSQMLLQRLPKVGGLLLLARLSVMRYKSPLGVVRSTASSSRS